MGRAIMAFGGASVAAEVGSVGVSASDAGDWGAGMGSASLVLGIG